MGTPTIRNRLTISAVLLVTALMVFFGSQRTPEETTPTAASPRSKPQPGNSPKAASTAKPLPSSSSDLFAEIAAHSSGSEISRRLQLIEKLVQLGPEGIPQLAQALRTAQTSASRAIYADALARLGTSEAVDALLGLLTSTTDGTARSDVLKALDALPPGQAVETLASGLALQLDPQTRDGVVATIARAADTSTVQFLAELYREPRAFPEQETNILSALGSIHAPAAVPALAELLRSSGDITLMRPSASALGKIGTPDALQPIAEALHFIGNTNPELRQLYLSTIAAVNNPEALPWLQKTATSPHSDPDLAKTAQQAIAQMQKP